MSDFCLVRQPLFGASGSLLGYDIRFRDVADGQQAFVESYLSGTFDLVRAKLPAFVACSSRQLVDDAFQIADPTSAILVLPRDLEVTIDVVAAISRYRDAKGSIALGGLSTAPAQVDALYALVDWVRVDMRQGGADAVRAVHARVAATVGARRPKIVADFVADAAMYEQAKLLKLDGYQGEFFSRPEPLPATDFPQSTMSAMRLMGLARDPKVNDRQLEDVISSDPVLMFQLLRLVNSAAVGLRGVSSIGQALRMVGRNAFLRWLSVAVAASRKATTGVDRELVRQAVERGRMLEQLVGGGREAGTLFLVGLFSLLDGVFRMPLADILERVALSEEANEALLDRTGPYADALTFAESYELGMFEHAAQLAEEMGVEASRLGELYASAIAWTGEALGSALDSQPAAPARGAVAGRR